jgi:hypothetical protein
MTFESVLEVLANLAAIGTAALAAVFFFLYHFERRRRRERLEKYIKLVYDAAEITRTEEGARTILHLMKNLGISETEIVDASFRSKCIKRLTDTDDDGRAAQLLLRYEPLDNS